VLNSLGEVACRASAGQRARERFSAALAIARRVGAPREEARALAGIGRSYLLEGDESRGTAHLRQARRIYERIGDQGAQRLREALASGGERAPGPAVSAWGGSSPDHC
jgi:hypothetical protein